MDSLTLIDPPRRLHHVNRIQNQKYMTYIFTILHVGMLHR
jgi:hypothetical protein